MKSHVDEIIDQRASVYGEFARVAKFSCDFKSLLERFQSEADCRLTYDQKESMHMIMHKIARIISGNPNYIDNWDDIAGYATLVANRLRADAPRRSFAIGDYVRKKSGSQWRGRVVGWYSTSLTPDGYAVESDTHAGSVQIYPASAIEKIT